MYVHEFLKAAFIIVVLLYLFFGLYFELLLKVTHNLVILSVCFQDNRLTGATLNYLNNLLYNGFIVSRQLLCGSAGPL